MSVRSSFRCLAGTTIALLSSVAFAASVQSNIGPGDPSMPVVFITSPACTGQGASPVLFESFALNVSASGSYTIQLVSTAEFASVYVHQTSFDPANGFVNCIAGDNSSPVTLTLVLNSGTNYFVTPFDDTFAQAGGAFTLTVDGPGTATLNRIYGVGFIGELAVPTLSDALLAALAMMLAAAAWARLSTARRRMR